MIRQVTEHHSEILVSDSGAWVDVSFNDEVQGSIVLSLTPKESRLLADTLLNASQKAEDRIPHGNS